MYVALAAVLLVGALIVPREFLISIAHMITKPETSIEQYRSYSDIISEDRETRIANIASDAILQILKDNGIDIKDSTNITQDISKQMARIISDETLEDIRERIIQQGAIIPLMAVVDENIDKLYDDLGTSQFFIEDMNFLQQEGLVTFEGNDFGRAKLTDHGMHVIGYIRRSDRSSLSSIGGLSVDLFEIPRELENIPISTIGESKSYGFGENGTGWHRFSVKGPTDFTIKVTSKGDPFISLYRSDEFDFVAEDDDSGSGLNSKIEIALDPGEYYIGVIDLMSKPDEYSLEIVKDEHS